ncbi:AlpA family phage regulatory protein [Dyella sp.]|uniref:helix-turn-helix transcriptional regulator n=1 Tax=Dyella sp. TaxID=1869338 RepID=UPI0028414F4E|nr:AlpA family phage regulatory protein [Dyella sp.]MDR3445730.1 AlpA family phage regulatory protein [Dyella sp.]
MNQTDASTPDNLIRLKRVLERVGVSRASLYRLIKAEQFPQPTKIGTMSAWPDSEVTDFIERAKASRTVH